MATPVCKILLMNVNGPQSTTTAELKKNALNHILDDFKPSIVFTQECVQSINLRDQSFKVVSGFLGNETPLLNYNPPGFIYNSNKFDCKRIPKSEFDLNVKSSDLDGFKRSYPNFVSRREDYEAIFAGRVCIAKFQSKPNSNCGNVLAMSWHGPWNYLRDLQDRKMMLDYIFQVVFKALKRYELPIIIGGDFNLEPTNWPMLPSDLQRRQPVDEDGNPINGPIRQDGAKIDFFLSTSDLGLSNVEFYRFEEPLGRRVSEVLDHDPIKATISINR